MLLIIGAVGCGRHGFEAEDTGSPDGAALDGSAPDGSEPDGSEPDGRTLPPGVIAYYAFAEGSGGTAFDTSNVGEALDFHFDTDAITWLPSALRIDAPEIIATAPATKIAERCMATNEISIEAWIVPSQLSAIRDGPARLVTMSSGNEQSLGDRTNFMLGQGDDIVSARYSVRVTTTVANTLVSYPATLQTELTHLVATIVAHDVGAIRLYINGALSTAEALDGDFSHWVRDLPLLLANEADGQREWYGEFHRLVIYDRALSLTDVRALYFAGAAD